MPNPIPLTLSLLALAQAAGGAQGEDPPPSRDAHDLSARPHAELTAELHALDAAHAHAALVSIGRSREGRAIEGLAIGPGGDRPAILLVANLDGPRLFADAAALDAARRLCAGYPADERVRALCDAATVIVLPRANPDAAERCIQGLAGAAPRFEARLGGSGVDDDRDGRAGEDGPEDVDGDGVIAWMRYADPDGAWIEDPHDARALVAADPAKGERGRYALVVEGRDQDGDERVAEDPERDARVDRNFPAGWSAHAPASGRFPTDEPEALALAELLVARPEIALVVTWDAASSLAADPKSVADDAPAVMRVPPAGVLASDAKVLAELGRRYRELLGDRAPVAGAAEDAGSFRRYAYEHKGLLTLDVALFDLPLADAPDGETRSDDARRLAWIDAQGPDEAWRFRPWTRFEHPELGPVEIGGFAPFARLLPPAGDARAIADLHFEHLLSLAEVPARVAIAECTVAPLGADVWRVDAAVEAAGLLPLLTRSSARAGAQRPARLELVLPDAAELLAGRRVELVSELGSGKRHEARWLVRGPAGVEIGVRVDTDHAGDDARAEVAR